MNIINTMETKFNSFLNNTPMYRLVVYMLLVIVFFAFILTFFSVLPYSPTSLLTSLSITLFTCFFTNFLVIKILNLPLQKESVAITALILFLVLLPGTDFLSIGSLVVASATAILSKYIIVARDTHIFNPAALGILVTTILGMGTAFWWVGSMYLLPVVLLTSWVIIRKTNRETFFFTGITVAIISGGLTSYLLNQNFFELLYFTLLSGPIIFFLAYMSTEPHTFAGQKWQQVLYATIIVILPSLSALNSSLYITPEASLLIGNIFTFMFFGRKKYKLKLEKIEQLNPQAYEYTFVSEITKKFKFKAGQYLEWLVPHNNPDDRGTRRYFTISSEPNKSYISVTTKFASEHESTYKTALRNLKVGDTVFASQLGGDFYLRNTKNKIIQIAGGIGITPFISQIRELLDKKNRTNATLFYCVKNTSDLVFVTLLQKAIIEIDLKVVCVVNEPIQSKSDGFFYETGYLTKEIIEKYINTKEGTSFDFYISGPNLLVDKMKTTIKGLHIKKVNIFTDFFPGF